MISIFTRKYLVSEQNNSKGIISLKYLGKPIKKNLLKKRKNTTQ